MSASSQLTAEEHDGKVPAAEIEDATKARSLDGGPKSALDRLFPQSWVAVCGLVGVFVLGLSLASIPFGIAYDRFDTRAEQCYDEETYYKLGPQETNHSYCRGFTYPYRLLEQSITSQALPTLLYLFHQFGQWIILWQAQEAKSRGEVGWKPDYQPNVYAKRMFALNMGLVIFKFVQSHITYDGLAGDVPEFSALYSVAIWLFFAMAIEMPRRGLLFGYWRSLGEGKYEFGQDMIAFIRKNHGYAISFGTTYNFWYHPIEGSPGFILGYLYQFCMILQSAFLFHPFHRNKFWTLILEMGVIPHALFISIFAANQTVAESFMFAGGFSFIFITTYMHGFDLSFWQKLGMTVAYFGVAIAAYVMTGRDLSNINEIFRIGSAFIFVPVGWVIWVIGCFFIWLCKGFWDSRPWTTAALWFAIWAAHMAAFYGLGPTGGRGVGNPQYGVIGV